MTNEPSQLLKRELSFAFRIALNSLNVCTGSNRRLKLLYRVITRVSQKLISATFRKGPSGRADGNAGEIGARGREGKGFRKGNKISSTKGHPILLRSSAAPPPSPPNAVRMVMSVIKRNGKPEPVSFDKITSRITKLSYGLNPQFVDPAYISQKCIKGVYDGVTTIDLDNLAAETAVSRRPPAPCVAPSALPCRVRTCTSGPRSAALQSGGRGLARAPPPVLGCLVRGHAGEGN